MPNNDENTIQEADLVKLHPDQFHQLIEQLEERNADLIALANTFHAITSLFSGKSGNLLKMSGTIMKILADKDQLERFQHIIPIIEKYLPQTAESNDKG
ncbi:MAG: hypothetical protein H7Y13_02395 [Sphingobacteriaceae bacterium]|nr:hypothetical protein [Sphingobacteriaceae bacterium]